MASSVSAYEQRRRENVLRNRNRLTELGVNKRIGQSDPDHASSAVGKRKHKRNAATQDKLESLPTRKSARLKNLPAISYELPEDDIDPDDVKNRRTRREKKVGKPNMNRKESTTAASSNNQRLGVLSTSPHSCKNLSIVPEEWNEGRVGNKLWPDHGLGPKAYVMTKLRGKDCTSPPKFSKYSGIQEWQNAVCLFVNISSKNGQVYKNLFLDDYRRMTWFAQRHAHEDTPVVTRLVELTAKDDASQSHRRRDPVLLFCRREGEPYIFCGRVGLSEFDKEHRPIKFVWTLVDRDQLMTSLDFFNILNSVN